MDFQTIKDKTSAMLSNPRILTFTLIGTTSLLIGAFLFFGDDVTASPEDASSEDASPEDASPDSNIFSTAAAAAAPIIPEAPINPFATLNEGEKEPTEQTGGKKRKQTKKKRTRKQRKTKANKRR